MNVQFYIYFEDEVLTVGVRSDEKFNGADFDGDFYFKYLEGDNHHICKFPEFGLITFPDSDGVGIYVNGEMVDKLGYEEDAESVQFSYEI